MAFVAAAGLALALLWLRWQGAPTPAALAAGDAHWHERLLDSVLAALASGGLVAVAMLAMPTMRAHGGLAVFAAPVLASGITLLAAAWLPRPAEAIAAWPWLLVAVSAVFALLSLPLLRERTFGALLAVPAIAALPGLLALRQARADALAAAPVAELQAAAARLGEPAGPIAMLLAGGEPPLPQHLVVAALRRPFWPTDLDVLAADERGPAAAWLQRLSLPLLRRTGRGFEIDRGGRRLPRREAPPWQPGLVVGNDRVDVFVRTGEPVTGVLFTPFGDLELVPGPAADGGVNLGPTAADAARLRASLAAMPPGSLIRALVVSRDAADAYGWIDQRLAGDRPR
ncbi:MAG: hypothetical protein IPK26_28875 [Planctomycetes bacterium]|nr:hypothetical protein [Planctomycetota bacterium]